MKRTIRGAAAVLVLAATGCTPAPLSPDFGNAVTANLAVQRALPMPTEAQPPEVFDGQRAADAVDRYRKGKVTQPVSATVTSVTTGGDS